LALDYAHVTFTVVLSSSTARRRKDSKAVMMMMIMMGISGEVFIDIFPFFLS